MSEATARDVTTLLQAWTAGEPGAFDELVPLVYDELRQLAHQRLRGERPGHPPGATSIVHEVYLRMAKAKPDRLETRGQFFFFAGKVMRRILVDAARNRLAAKRGGDAPHVPIDGIVAATTRSDELVALDDALEALGRFDERKMKVVELRHFAGLTVQQTAETLGVSPDTVMRDWRMARLWLFRELGRGAPETGETQQVG